MIEIERKAWVTAPEALAQAVTDVFGPPGVTEKRDRYFLEPMWMTDAASRQARKAPAGDAVSARRQCRLRQEGATYKATAKIRRFEGTTEVNEEIEFGVTEPEGFVDFVVRYLRFENEIDKHKRTRFWKISERLTVELSEVVGLGWFLEVEYLADDATATSEAKTQLDGIFARFAPHLGAEEARPYTRLLKEARKDPQQPNSN